jgi:hypothetical protein
MGHSFITGRGRQLELHNKEIEVAVSLLWDTARTMRQTNAPEYQAVLDDWLSMVDARSPGLPSIDLDRVLDTRAHTERTLQLFDETVRRLRQQGATIPGDYFNRILGLTGLVVMKDVPVEYALSALNKFRSLIAD